MRQKKQMNEEIIQLRKEPDSQVEKSERLTFLFLSCINKINLIDKGIFFGASLYTFLWNVNEEKPRIFDLAT
jgi:hypothetical protein